MSIVFRIIGSIVILAVFTSIVITSFFSRSEYLSLLSLQEHEIQENSLLETGTEEIINVYHPSGYEYLYSDQQDLKIASSNTMVNIDIRAAGKYFSSLRNINKEYSFVGVGYKIIQDGIGEIFIDNTTKAGRVFILSLSTPVHIILTNDSGDEVYTDIFLNPHMYLEFQPARARYLKNADVIRVQTVYKLGYIGDTFLQSLEDSNNNYRDYLQGSDIFLRSIVSHISSRDEKKQKLLGQLLHKKVGTIPGYNLIQRYIHLFVNIEKKKIFYKNIVLSEFLDLIHSQKYKKSKIIQILQDLDTLKNMDLSSYKELERTREDISILLVANNDKEFIFPQAIFALLGDNTKNISSLYFPLYGKALFSYYDEYGKLDTVSLDLFLSSFQDFLNSQESSDQQRTQRYQYFSYFLEQHFLYLLQAKELGQDIDSIISTLESYIKNSEYAYNDTVTGQLTSLYIYNNILKSIDNFLREQYFLLARTEGELLQMHPERHISAQKAGELEGLINEIFKIYDSKEKILDDSLARDRAIKKDIIIRKKHMQEYFSALQNYEQYSSKYDISKKNLLDVNTLGGNDREVLSEDNVMNYLSRFSGLSLENAYLQMQEDYYYHIENVFIAGSNFSFDIYPYSSYKIDNIIIDGKKSNFVYKLENIENLWEDKYKRASKEEKEKYDFNRFFLITFFGQKNTLVEEYTPDDLKLGEDKAEIVFKRDKLLGKQGEFSGLQDIMSIRYDDIRLEKNGLKYNIFLDKVPLHVSIIDAGQTLTRVGEFSGEYVLTDTEHYFKKSSILVYKGEKVDVEYLSLHGRSIKLLGKITITDMKKLMEDLLKYLDDYERVYNSILSLYPNIDVSVEYNVYNKKTSFKFDSQGKKYTIIFANGMIEKIYLGTQKLISHPIDISNIAQYIQ